MVKPSIRFKDSILRTMACSRRTSRTSGFCLTKSLLAGRLVRLLDFGMTDKMNEIAIGKATHEKHRFRASMKVRGLAVPVSDPRLEIAVFYKTSGIKVDQEAGDGTLAMISTS